MATPVVAGLAAMVMVMHPDLNGSQVEELIMSHVTVKDAYKTRVSSGGHIDALRTLEALGRDGIVVFHWKLLGCMVEMRLFVKVKQSFSRL